jgi:hypothetical protein
MSIVEELSKSITASPFGMPRQAHCATGNFLKIYTSDFLP